MIFFINLKHNQHEKRIFFICTLFVVLTGFNQQERVVEQGNADLLGRASVAGEPPVILQQLMHCMVHEGGIATFIAEFTPSDGSCTITWSKNDRQIEKNARIKTYIDNGTATLVINKVSRDDGGIYRIEVKNAHGEVKSEALLAVIIE